MARRSLFSKIFGAKEQKFYGQTLELLNGYNAHFTRFDRDLYKTPQIRMCIDAIARNGAKLNPKHIRATDREYVQLNRNIARLLSQQPNEIDNAYSFYYKIISLLYLNNNAFVYIARDVDGVPVGLYPLNPRQYKLFEYKGDIYIQFSFDRRKYVASLKDDIIHLKRFYCEDDVFGDSNEPVVKTMSVKHIMREGLINAIKTTSSIRGILKTTKAMLKPEDIKATRDQFVNDFITNGDRMGIGGLDATTDFQTVNITPVTATESQIKEIDTEILSYFGISQEIIQSDYTEDKWNAFYQSVLEPLAVQMGLEFTIKLFTLTERFHGNRIVFEANRLEYASNKTKIDIARYLNNYLTVNEIRKIFNLDPLEDGDVRMQDLNHISSDIADDYQGGNENE